ncbi:MAG: RNA polymerase sigma factor [Thermoleophilaceae bacterium]|nr:RNA polymerase sigma factor [Thermoleophilaceae bacterium]
MEASPTYEPLAQHPAATRLMNAQPDAVLCRLAARGNVSAYDAIYQRYRQPVYAFVFHLLGRPNGNEDAEDITQDVFTRAFAGIREQRVDGAFKGWLFTIARNRTFDLIRGGRQKVVSLDAENAEPPLAPQAEEPAEQAEQRAEFAWLMTAVADLPERQREALLLREMGGFSHERIAAELGTSVSATKKLISRGRDGVGAAAASVGYKRRARRRLGHDLAMAAPIVPISMTLASLGVTGGAAAGGAVASGVFAGGGAAIGGKAAATALTFLAIGGGAVVVEQDAKHKNQGPQIAEQRQAVAGPVHTETVANGRPGTRPGDVDGRRGRGSDDPADGRRGTGGNSGPGSTPGDRGSRDDSGRRGSGGDGGRGGDDVLEPGDDSGGHRGSGKSGSSDSETDSGSGSDDVAEGQEIEPPESGNDGGSDQSGKDSGDSSGSGSSGSGDTFESDSTSGGGSDD